MTRSRADAEQAQGREKASPGAESGDAFFVKSASGGASYKLTRPGRKGADQLLREAEKTTMAAAILTPDQRPMAPSVVEVGSSNVVFTNVGGPSMRELYLRPAGELERGAFRLGVILAALHRSRRPKGLEDAPRLVWSLTSVTPEALATMTAASLEYIAKLQESDPLIDSLEALQGEETPAAVIHRDVTLLNVIVPSSGDVVLVDWELAGIGDPAVDLATPVADALSLWLITSRRERRSLTCDLAGWQCWRSFARALMEGYGGHAGIHKAKIGSFAGAYLLTRGLAITEARGRLSGDAQVLAHVGQRLVVEPMRLWRLVGGSSSGGGG